MDYSSFALKPIALGLFLVQSSTVMFVLLLSVSLPALPPAQARMQRVSKCLLSVFPRIITRSCASSSTGGSVLRVCNSELFSCTLFSTGSAQSDAPVVSRHVQQICA